MRGVLASLLCGLSLAAQVSPLGFHGHRLPASFFAGNRARLMEKMKALGPGTVAVVKSMPEQPRNGDGDHAYRQDSDFYYLTGVEEAGAIALLEAGSEKPYTLLVRPRDPKREAWNGPRLGVEGAKKVGADQALDFPEAERALEEALRKAQRVVLVCNFDEPFRKQVLDAMYPPGSSNWRGNYTKVLVDGRPWLGEMRLIKQPMEIELLQKAVDVSIDGHLAAMRATPMATNEGHVAAAFEGAVRGLGARFLGYDTIAGAGNDACTLHYPFADAPLQANSLMLLDAGAEVGYYTADITRTWPLSGSFSTEQRALYDLVLKAQNAAINCCRPGQVHIAGHKAAMRILSDGMVDLGILKGSKEEAFAQGIWKRFTLHGTSHWLGLDVHDTGDYGTPDPIYPRGGNRLLQPGMVLTVEPGIYIPKGAEGVDPKWQGIGVRIEDDILVTADGPRNLSDRLPRKPEELERIVQEAARKGRR